MNPENLIYILISFAISAVLTYFLLPVLRRIKAGQSIREEGPQAHLAKAGTPTMGGLAIVAAVSISSLISPQRGADMLAMVVIMLLHSAIGFFDDYIKVVKKRNLGLTAKQKIALQLIFALALALYGHFACGDTVIIPFIKQPVNFGILYIPFVMFMTVAMTNAVNLTDGLDGLSSSVTAVVTIFFALITTGPAQVFSLAICGAVLGFLVFNHFPAKIFMGDTGSLALGGALAAMAVVSRCEFALPIAGGIYVAEVVSVMIQVFVFKTQNGRRFFRMAPLHHHFELGGWHETKVVKVFALVSAVLGLITLLIF